ncbi:MAG: EcsC family protein [Fibrobacter sp.]|nr:EcsC family protein [Fibrobacter sp.]
MAKEKSTNKITNLLAGLLFELITDIPESMCKPSDHPDKDIEGLIKTASVKAAAVSATLSIPAGITGIVVSIPDIIAVWKIQAQLVSDIALTYGKVAILNRESMMVCLFKHSAAHLLKDLVTHTGPRIIVHKLSTAALKKALDRISMHFSSKFLRRIALKAVPAIGAVGNGAISFWDTKQVGKTAQAYFKSHQVPPPLNLP